MSYDLYFYKRNDSNLSDKDLVVYLNNQLGPPNERGNQWFVEHKDSETYFSLNLHEPNEDNEHFDGFRYTFLSFNLNFLRPDFFGIHAFRFVDQLIANLGLLVLNPQDSEQNEVLTQPLPNELYRNWSELNAGHAIRLGKEYGLNYYPLEKSNYFYFYNVHRSKIQERLGNDYFVPKLMLLKRESDGQIATLCIWPEHIPYVFPDADYYLIIKKYKKLFRTIEESGVISSAVFNKNFGGLLEDFDFKGCKIIRPEQAQMARKTFNSIGFECQLIELGKRIELEVITNVIPE